MYSSFWLQFYKDFFDSLDDICYHYLPKSYMKVIFNLLVATFVCFFNLFDGAIS